MGAAFDSRDAGTLESAWTTGWLTALPTLEPPAPGGRLLIVAAHPDDETLGAGGLIATAAAVGAEVTIVVCSDGEASHPNSTTHTPSQLADRRRAEVTAAVFELCPRARLHFLGRPDSGLAGQVDELTNDLRRYAEPASVVVTPWLGDRHPDHAACATAGARVAQELGIDHWQYPIWAWHWGRPESPEFAKVQLRRLRLDDAAAAAKRRAIAAHTSQHSALSPNLGDEAILSDTMLAHFDRSDEVFVLSRRRSAADRHYFDDLYAKQDDPWGLADRFYEHRKRELLLASLPRPHFRRAFEPGCATGLLTVELARRCDEVVAWDVADVAVGLTIARTDAGAGPGRVFVEANRIPATWPTGRFDLLVLSEVGYYCADQGELKDRIEASLADDGVLVACHWRHPAPEHPVPAESVHESVGRGLQRIVHHREADFLLDVWTRDGVSVATAEGIVA